MAASVGWWIICSLQAVIDCGLFALLWLTLQQNCDLFRLTVAAFTGPHCQCFLTGDGEEPVR